MKKGFTLIELMIGLAILVMMAAILIGILNPVALINRARDAQRKKDLRRISISFEDYFNDKSCYPDTDLVAELTNKVNCRSVNVFPWLTPWPCDPNGSAYQILIDSQSCPKWFKVLTKLENKNDKDIRLDLGIDAGEIGYNYGVSSGNISFGGYPGDYNPDCLVNNPQVCWYINPSGNCNTIEGCNGNNCWRDGCRADCQVSCCGSGCN